MKFIHNDNGVLTEREYFSVADAECFVGTHHHAPCILGSYVDDGFGNGVLRPNVMAKLYYLELAE